MPRGPSLRPDMRFAVNPGPYSVAIGPNSAQVMEARGQFVIEARSLSRQALAYLSRERAASESRV